MENLTNDLDYLLKNVGILHLSDLYNLELFRTPYLHGHLSNTRYPWVDELFKLASRFYYYAETNIKESSEQIFFINKQTLRNSTELSKFGCLLPQSTYLGGGTIVNNQEHKYVDLRFLRYYFMSKDVIKQKLCLLSPIQLTTQSNGFDMFYEILEMHTKDKNQSSVLDTCGNRTLMFQNGKYIKIDIPWLYGVSVNDFIELKDKYEYEFMNYSQMVHKIASNAASGIEVTEEITTSLNEICISMKIILDKKKNELFRKGVKAFLGVCATIIPFVHANMNQYLDPKVISGVFGSASLVEILDIGLDASHMREMNNENPYWFLWKWYNKSNQLQREIKTEMIEDTIVRTPLFEKTGPDFQGVGPDGKMHDFKDLLHLTWLDDINKKKEKLIQFPPKDQ